MLYLYALVRDLDDLTGLTGIDNEALSIVSLQGIAVVTGWLETAPPLDREHLEAQDALVRHLHNRAASLLPMRFGAAFPSVENAERAMKNVSAGLNERLERARGAEQMTMRVLRAAHVADNARTVDATPVTPETGLEEYGPGLRYLAGRAARATPPEIVPLLNAVKTLQRATRVEAGRRDGVVATIYHLIDRGSADGYRRAVEHAAESIPALIVRISGPSPCFAFA